MKPSSLISLNLTIITIVLVLYILHAGASMFINFVIALLISLTIISLAGFFRRRGLHKVLAFIFALLTIILFFWGVGYIINSNIEDIIALAPQYQQKFVNLTLPLLQSIPYVDVSHIEKDILTQINIGDLLSGLAQAITKIISSLGVIFFYTLFILLEHRFFSQKLALIFGKRTHGSRVFEVMEHIKHDVRSYFVIKTVVSLITGILSYIVLLIFGVDFALFWAFLIFLLNFIPTIGSIIAVMFPLFFSFIQFEGVSFPFIGLLIFLPAIQVLMGNIIEPRFVGNKLNLSPLVIIISLGFWGVIWGVVGMLLSVPIMVIINIILSNFNSTRPIAILLSEKGNIRTEFIPSKSPGAKNLLKKVKGTFRKKK